MSPIFVSLKLTGLHFPTMWKLACKQMDDTTPKFQWSNPWRIYSTVIVTLLWLNVLRTAIIFKDNNQEISILFMKFVMMSWVLLTACNASICYYASVSADTLDAFFKEWYKTSPVTSQHCLSYIRRRVTWYALSSWFFILCNMGFVGYGLYRTSNFDPLLLPCTKDMPCYNTGNNLCLYQIIIYNIV